MNCSIYIFGRFNSGYTQYPEDSTSAIFQRFIGGSSAPTQLIAHRENSIMYYGYVRKCSANLILGFSIALNELMLTDLSGLFTLFESVTNELIMEGTIIGISENGKFISKCGKLYLEKEKLSNIISRLRGGINQLPTTTKLLPPLDYSTSIDSSCSFAITDAMNDIVKSTIRNSYTFICKSAGINKGSLGNALHTIQKLSYEKEELNEKIRELKFDLRHERTKQRNMLWVGLLTIISIIFGVIIYNKVLFPSEVTKYDTGDFTYYGPIKDNLPHGLGVAIYKEGDPDGRLYYIGNFNMGHRQDENATLFYKDGNYYKGSMEDDKWGEGIMFNRSERQHFEGTFVENEPSTGIWYQHKDVQHIHGRK